MAIPLEFGRSALVIIDAQRDFLGEDGALARAGLGMSTNEADILAQKWRQLAAAYRSGGQPVVFVSTAFRADYADSALPRRLLEQWRGTDGQFLVEDTPGTDLLDGLRPETGDGVVVKKGLSAFQHTHLDRLLSNLGVEQCVLAGPVPQSLSGSARIGALLGYTIFIATDAVHPKRSPYLDTLGNRAEFLSTRDVLAAVEDPILSTSSSSAPEYAMVIVDMQNDFVHPGSVKRRLGYSDAMEDEKRERLIANNAELAAAMRARGWPVVFVGVGRRPDLLDDGRSRTVAAARPIPPEARYLEPDTWGSEFIEGLRPQLGDLVVQKKGNSGFGFTPLHRILRNIGVRRCLVTGGSSSGCVSDTFREGLGLGYEMTVVSDATYPVGSKNISELGELGEMRTTEDVLTELRVPVAI